VCLADNYSRGILDRALEKLLLHPEVTLVEVDLLDRDAVLSLGTGFDAIFHLGAIIGVRHVLERPYEVLVDNTHMLDNVIALARRQFGLSRLLFASTSEVYAGTLKHFDLPVPTPESAALTVTALNAPRTSYMLSKIMGEAMLQQAGLPFTIFRPHNVYGPRMGMAHVIPEQLNRAFEADPGDRLDVHSPDHTRVFCYIDDAVEFLRRMLEAPSCVGQTLNVGTEAPEVSIREVVQTCIAVTGKDLGINALPPMPGSPKRRAPAMRLPKSLLGYESRVNLREGITRTWEWYRTHRFECGGPVTR
jgi:nucleoside-diphosphate-sugar epimerase